MSRNIFPPSGEYHVTPDNTSHNVTNMEKYIFLGHAITIYYTCISLRLISVANETVTIQDKKRKSENETSAASLAQRGSTFYLFRSTC